MRLKYKESGWYDRKELEENAKTIKERLKKQTTQYKIYAKRGLDEISKVVVDCLF